MVANFQYLVTCLAFSISKPFRKPIHTNYAFFFCVVFLTVFDFLCIYLPGESAIPSTFDLIPFTTDDGVEHFKYKYWITLGVVVNGLLTYFAEMLIATYVTR